MIFMTQLKDKNNVDVQVVIILLTTKAINNIFDVHLAVNVPRKV